MWCDDEKWKFTQEEEFKVKSFINIADFTLRSASRHFSNHFAFFMTAARAEFSDERSSLPSPSFKRRWLRASQVISHLIAFRSIPCSKGWWWRKMQFPKNSPRSRFQTSFESQHLVERLNVNYAESFIVEGWFNFVQLTKLEGGAKNQSFEAWSGQIKSKINFDNALSDAMLYALLTTAAELLTQ